MNASGAVGREFPVSSAAVRRKPSRLIIGSIAKKARGRIESGSLAVHGGCVWADEPEIYLSLGYSDLVNSVAFSPDERSVLAGSEGENTARVWNVAMTRTGSIPKNDLTAATGSAAVMVRQVAE
jgi:hypothetical protein